MNKTWEEIVSHAKSVAEDLELQKHLDNIDFQKVDINKLKKIDFSRGLDSARQGLEQLPKVRVTSEPAKPENDGFLGGVILGVILGAILALVFAPKSGAETRELVAHTVEDLKQKVTGQDDEMGIVNDVEDAVNEANEAAADAFNEEPAIERNFG